MLNTNRRSLLASIPAAALAVTIPATALAANESDATIKAAWAQWLQTRADYNAAPVPEDDAQHKAQLIEEQRQWAIMDEAEETIRATAATTPQGAQIQLWVALIHSVTTREEEEAVLRRDLSAIAAFDHELDWHARLIVAAIRSLDNMAA